MEKLKHISVALHKNENWNKDQWTYIAIFKKTFKMAKHMTIKKRKKVNLKYE